MREVEIKLDPNFINVVGSLYGEHLTRALGYLSMWAIPTGESHGDTSGRYTGKVKIYGDRNGDLHAIYHNSKGEATYNIGAVLHDDGHYSTHS